jgi:hypothetical protein
MSAVDQDGAVEEEHKMTIIVPTLCACGSLFMIYFLVALFRDAKSFATRSVVKGGVIRRDDGRAFLGVCHEYREVVRHWPVVQIGQDRALLK